MRSSTKILTGLAALALMWSASRASAVCSGDVNGDSSITTTDAGILLACSGTRANPPADPNPSVCDSKCGGMGILACGDVNLDGQITTADAILVLNQAISPGKNVVPLCASQGPTVPCGSVINAAAGHITANEVLSSCEYLINGTVFVDPGVVLTIRPGAVIKGVAGAPTVSALVFLPQANCLAAPTSTTFTARINAAGTPTQPIIFTSDQSVGARKSGDWGGLAFNGCSRVNDAGGVSEAEGLVGVQFGGGTDCRPADGGPVGGTALCSDSSGLMRYARTEFAGNELSPDNELNTYTQNGLGSNTKFTYLQAHMGLDDNFEWFGGTIQEKHFVSTGARDDNFDWQLGSDIKLQYGVAAQFLPNLDALSDHGFEGDNNERGFSNTAPSQPEFCNITVVGAKGQGGTCAASGDHPNAPCSKNADCGTSTPCTVTRPYPSGGSWWGALLRRGTPARITKTIVTNFISGGFNLRDPETARQACLGVSTLRTNGVAAPTDATHQGTCVGGSNNAAVCSTNADCCLIPADCPVGSPKSALCLPYTLADPAHNVCYPGPGAASPNLAGTNCNVDSDCGANAVCGRFNLLFRNTLFYDNGDTTGSFAPFDHTTVGNVKSGGNNTGANCNSAEWAALLLNNATLRVKANATFPDATLDPGIQAGGFWPPISLQPSNPANVQDDPASGGYDCGVGLGSFFDSTKYLGGIDPSGTDWTQTPGGWISYVTQ